LSEAITNGGEAEGHMQIFADAVVEEIHAVILCICYSFTLDCTPDGVNNTVNILLSEEFGNLTRRKQIVQ
jgi:hypothetical protein